MSADASTASTPGATNYVIGCDLATCMSMVAVWKNNNVEIIPSETGNRCVPSVVSFGEERLIGEAAKTLSASNPGNTIFDAKRLIGRQFNDPIVQRDMKLWPFKVVDDGKNRPQIVVDTPEGPKNYYAEEISAMVLTKLKQMAESQGQDNPEQLKIQGAIDVAKIDKGRIKRDIAADVAPPSVWNAAAPLPDRRPGCRRESDRHHHPLGRKGRSRG